MQHITGTDRNQTSFTTLETQIAANNPVRVIEAFAEKLDLQKMHFNTQIKAEGRRPFHPKMFLKLYLYGYLNRVRSSRKLETECRRNIELHWLLEELTPNYHSIADFRKQYSRQLKFVFKAFTAFLKDNDCFGKEVIAVDSTKVRAQNASKNNYNAKKIERHLNYIEQKASQYLQELESMDREENNIKEESIKKEKVKQKLEQLEKRKINYEHLRELSDHSIDGQVSTTDTESKAMIHRTNVVAVSYNVQTAADAKHNLVADFENTNKNDSQALAHTAQQAKEALDIKAGEPLTVLSDKGYHNGSQIHQCEQNNITTITAYREQPAVKHLEKEFLVTSFPYNHSNDTYTCPNGATMVTTGTLHFKKREDGETSYRFKKYTTPACAVCAIKQQCTKLKKRAIERSEYQDAIERNNERVRTQKELYLKRQQIIEHIFGTIKRSWGYTYTLLKGIKKVNGEMALIFTAYNMRRSMTIFGVEELLTRLNEWKGPDYTALITLLNAFLQYMQSKWLMFIKCTQVSQKNYRAYIACYWPALRNYKRCVLRNRSLLTF